MKHTEQQLKKLSQLIEYSDKYNINVQFWPDQTAVYIDKDDIELQSYGGDFDFAIDSALSYLKRINSKTRQRRRLINNMWMTQYVSEIRRQLRDVYNFTPTGGTEHEPLFDNIPDGEYPMTIEGKVDKVRTKDNRLYCCNFD